MKLRIFLIGLLMIVFGYFSFKTSLAQLIFLLRNSKIIHWLGFPSLNKDHKNEDYTDLSGFMKVPIYLKPAFIIYYSLMLIVSFVFLLLGAFLMLFSFIWSF